MTRSYTLEQIEAFRKSYEAMGLDKEVKAQIAARYMAQGVAKAHADAVNSLLKTGQYTLERACEVLGYDIAEIKAYAASLVTSTTSKPLSGLHLEGTAGN